MELTLGGTSTEVLGNEVTPNPSINRTSIGRQRDALYNSCIGERRGTQASAGTFYPCLLNCCRSFRERKRRGAACATPLALAKRAATVKQAGIKRTSRSLGSTSFSNARVV